MTRLKFSKENNIPVQNMPVFFFIIYFLQRWPVLRSSSTFMAVPQSLKSYQGSDLEKPRSLNVIPIVFKPDTLCYSQMGTSTSDGSFAPAPKKAQVLHTRIMSKASGVRNALTDYSWDQVWSDPFYSFQAQAGGFSPLREQGTTSGLTRALMYANGMLSINVLAMEYTCGE